MKKINLKAIFGALTLFLLGIVYGKANSNKASVTALYYTKGTPGTCTILTTCVSSTILTTGGGGFQMTFTTSISSHTFKVYSTSSCTASHKVHANG
jgi:hypothetical protein